MLCLYLILKLNKFLRSQCPCKDMTTTTTTCVNSILSHYSLFFSNFQIPIFILLILKHFSSSLFLHPWSFTDSSNSEQSLNTPHNWLVLAVSVDRDDHNNSVFRKLNIYSSKGHSHVRPTIVQFVTWI